MKNKSRKEYIFERFYESLIESYQSERSVKFYADQLCLTPKHLSGVVKEVSGKTVGEWIDELVILEAKALLNSSSMNIQEIADRLNFANQFVLWKVFQALQLVCLLKNTGKAAKIIEHRSAHGLVFPVSSKDKRQCVPEVHV